MSVTADMERRYEKEFETVIDVFELQVRAFFSFPDSTRLRCELNDRNIGGAWAMKLTGVGSGI